MRARRRAAQAPLECSIARPERYEHQGCPGIHAARGTTAAFYTIHHNSESDSEESDGFKRNYTIAAQKPRK